ncbi:hypothetical protein BHM03_00047395, partial [Ensete ventricosum]
DAVGNSPGVHWELAKGIRSLPRWCKGVHRKKTKTHRKIVRGSRKTYRETSPKVSGRSLGTCREIARGRP